MKLFGKNSPVVIAHWLDRNEKDYFDELVEINQLLDTFTGVKPKISCCCIESNSPDEFLIGLDNLITDNIDFQVLYITSHGNESGLSYDTIGSKILTYKCLGNFLEQKTGDNEYLQLVFGSCMALSKKVSIENYIPDSFSFIAGFTKCPSPINVASLFAWLLKSHVQMGSDVSKLINDAPKTSKTGWDKIDEQFDYIKGNIDRVIDNAYKNPLEFITKPEDEGDIVIIEKKWQRKHYNVLKDDVH